MKNFIKKIAAVVLSATLITGIATAAVPAASAAETSFKLDARTQSIIYNLADNCAEMIPNPLAKALVKSGLFAFSTFFAEQNQETDEEKLEKYINQKSEELQASVERLSSQSAGEYNNLTQQIDTLKCQIDNNSYHDYANQLKADLDRMETNMSAVFDNSADGKANLEALASGSVADEARALGRVFSVDIDTNKHPAEKMGDTVDNYIRHYQQFLTEISTEYRNGSNILDALIEDNTAKYKNEDIANNDFRFFAADSDSGSFKTADYVYRQNAKTLNDLKKLADEYCDMIMLGVYTDRLIYQANGEAESALLQDWTNEALMIRYENIYNKPTAKPGIETLLQKAQNNIDNSLKNATAITIDNVTKNCADPYEMWRIVNRSLCDGYNVTVTLNSDISAQNGNGFSIAHPLTVKPQNEGFNSTGGYNIKSGKTVTVNGNSHTLDLSANPSGTAFTLESNAKLVLDGVTIKCGAYGVSFDNSKEQAQLTLTNTTFDGCGTALRFISNGSGNVNASLSTTFSNSTGGGAVIGGDCNATFTGCHFVGNTSSQNGGALQGNSNCTLKNCDFVSNHSDQNGGAVSNVYQISGCLFLENTANKNGGAYFENSSRNFTISDTDFENNTSGNNGGAMYATGLHYESERTAGKIKDFINIRCYSQLTNVTVNGNSAAQKGNDIFCHSYYYRKLATFIGSTYFYNLEKDSTEINVSGGDRLDAYLEVSTDNYSAILNYK